MLRDQGRRGMGLMGVLVILIMTSVSISSTRSTNFALPSNCSKLCGNISIQYPFGIEDGCFRPRFNLTCSTNTDTASPQLLLGDGTVVVTGFDMESGLVHIDSPVTPTMAVEANSHITTSLINLQNWPFSINLKKTSYVSESETYLAYLMSNNLYAAGGSATVNLVDAIRNIFISSCSINAMNDTGYCEIILNDLDSDLQTHLAVQLTRRINETEPVLTNTSSVAAVMFDSVYTSDEALQRFTTSEDRAGLKASLAWYMDDHSTCEEARQNSATYACRSRNSDCYDVYPTTSYTIGYLCRCSLGYEGNPYLPDGCQDTNSTFIPANDCPVECGNVTVLYPFGLKEGCYRDEAFALTCNETSGASTLLYQGYVVTDISIENGLLDLYAPGYYSDFSDKDTPLTFLREQMSFSWAVSYQSCEDSRKNMTTFACVDRRSSCIDINTTSTGQVQGYRCKCLQGYEGNPYINNGCKDINECNFPEQYICNGLCTNTEGSFNCTCPPGTSGDPRRHACIPNKNQTLLLGAMLGASIGIGLLLSSILLVILSRKWKIRKQKKIREKNFHQNHGLLLQQLISSSEYFSERTKIFSLEEIEKATNNFDESRVLGSGGHGIVYKGILSDLRVVAIKKSKIVEKCEIDQFINEVAVLSQINHRNVVRLFGCCLESEVPLLVYEFITNGSLLDHLHAPVQSKLSWDDRLRILVESAGAIAYLHSAASISIFHRDIKSSNILLDEALRAKVSDFGASRFNPLDETHIFTVVQGTFGYLDPEYYQTGLFTEKSDVYSFGVILLELLTGKKPTRATRIGPQQNLAMYFLEAIKENRAFDLVEALVMKEATKQELVEFINLIEMCLSLESAKRPTMKEVEYKLQCMRKTTMKKIKPTIAEKSEDLISSVSTYPSNSELIYLMNQGNSRSYSLEEELMWSQHHPR